MKATTGFTGEITFDHTKPDGTMQKLMDSTRLNQLGCNISKSLRDGLASVYRDFKNYEELK